MLEFIGSGVIGSLFGGLFRLAPEVLKFFDKVCVFNVRPHSYADQVQIGVTEICKTREYHEPPEEGFELDIRVEIGKRDEVV